MRRNLSYSKEGDRKLRDTVKQLKAAVSRLRKENEMLREELLNIVKPIRPRKEKASHIPAGEPPEKYGEGEKTMTQAEWRQDFTEKFKPILEKRLKEIKGEE